LRVALLCVFEGVVLGELCRDAVFLVKVRGVLGQGLQDLALGLELISLLCAAMDVNAWEQGVLVQVLPS
jgi:hypothetical protein